MANVDDSLLRFGMPRSFRWVHISLEAVGGFALLAGVGWTILHLPVLILGLAFRNFSGANCDDSEQQTIVSPDGNHSVKSYHRVCGAGNERANSFFVVDISTGNDNKGYEFTPIVSLRDLAPRTASVVWDSAEQVSVYYPATAGVDNAYARTFGVNIVLHPRSTP